MSPSSIMWAILIVIFVVGRALKSARSESGRRAAAGVDDEGFEAAPEEIQEFLRSLTTAAQRRAAGGEGGVPGAAERARPAGPARVQAGGAPLRGPGAPARARPPGPARVQAGAAPFWAPAPAVEEMPDVRPAPQPRRVRTQSRKKPTPRRKSPPREVVAATERAAAAAPKKPRGDAAPVLALRGTDLKRAVIWAEVLGPPVSRRRNRRLPLGPQQ